MIDEFDFGLYYSLIEDERFRNHYLENNDDFYTQFLFCEGLTEYKSIDVINIDKSNIWYVWWDMVYKHTGKISPYDIEQLLTKKIAFNIKITWEGEEYIFERIEDSKIFKRKYSDGE